MKQFLSEINFPYNHFTTTKIAGNMKNEYIRNAFLESIKLDSTKLVFAGQIHSSKVQLVNTSYKNCFINNCDGLITTNKDIALGVLTADCVPILISSKNCEFKAAIHAGWRGIAKGIIENTLDILKNKLHISLDQIKIYLGPHIRSCCYEVNFEMGDQFNIKLNGDKLDLSEIVFNKFKNFGVNKFFDIKYCTFHEKKIFFSHRRNDYERMLSIIYT
ncbi:MAG: peptidoglycan editing factor PgeF [Endomicrobium sp.]|jgi:YfiH family protein|nr:peptidoglycan editing factor PgeF [Endomicrobium sp.]